ncbi:MAG TPA: WS/DGAT domain-containing protein, partial [Polyangia bacterium]
GELAALSLPPARRFAWRLSGLATLVALVARAIFRPTVMLLQNRSNDYTGDNGTVHLVYDEAILAPWNAARKRIGASLNSLLTAALFAANARRHRARGVPLGRVSSMLLMETRPRDRGFVSFANHLASFDVTLPLGDAEDLPTMARAIQAQVDTQRRANRPLKRLLAERGIALGMRLSTMRQLVFESKHPSYNLNFSNLIALDFPMLAGDGWRVDDVRITTPVGPRNGIALTVIRYGGRLTFNFNYKSSAASRDDAEALSREFSTVLAELQA